MSPAAKAPQKAVKVLEKASATLAELLDQRTDINAEVKALKEKIEKVMIDNHIPEWNHAGIELSLNEKLSVKNTATKKPDDE